MPACLLTVVKGEHKNTLDGQYVKVPESGDCQELLDPNVGITSSVLRERADVTEATVASLIAAVPERDAGRFFTESRDHPGLVLGADGQLYKPGTGTDAPRRATLQEIEAARAEGRGVPPTPAAPRLTTAQELAEDVRGVMALTGVDEATARAIVFNASKFAPSPVQTQFTATEQLTELANAIQVARPEATREDALSTAAVSLGFTPAPTKEPRTPAQDLQELAAAIKLANPALSDEEALRDAAVALKFIPPPPEERRTPAQDLRELADAIKLANPELSDEEALRAAAVALKFLPEPTEERRTLMQDLQETAAAIKLANPDITDQEALKRAEIALNLVPAVVTTPTMSLNELADAIQLANPQATRQEALADAAAALKFTPAPDEPSVEVLVRQPDGTDVTLKVSPDAALRFFQDVTTLSEQERANLAREALTVRSQNISLRGQDIQAMTAQDANLIAFGALQVSEGRLRLDRVLEAQDVLFKERGEVIRGLIPDSFIRRRPGGQEVAEFRFPQILEVLRAAGAGDFDIEQFDIGIVRIDPEAAAQRIIEAAPATVGSVAAGAAVVQTGAALEEMRAAGVPLPERTEAA